MLRHRALDVGGLFLGLQGLGQLLHHLLLVLLLLLQLPDAGLGDLPQVLGVEAPVAQLQLLDVDLGITLLELLHHRLPVTQRPVVPVDGVDPLAEGGRSLAGILDGGHCKVRVAHHQPPQGTEELFVEAVLVVKHQLLPRERQRVASDSGRQAGPRP